jgi:valine dehydrogenase (NAD+)
MSDALSAAEHEQVVRFRDDTTGLLGYVAIYSTALGPALGGTRFRRYADEADALADVLRLARAMSYKNALAGLPHGGGKAVIIGDPLTDKTPELLRAYGRFLESLGGRYVTACDAGTSVADMDVIDETCHWVTGRSPARGGCGDSSVLTAYGLFEGMRAAAQVRWGSASLAGRRVGIRGVGKVGSHLVGHLLQDGAEVMVTDVDPTAVARVLADHPGVEALPDGDALVATPLDVLAPCSLGAELDDAVAAALSAQIVCGAANNQLAHPGVADTLAARGILYVPDFLVNSGGVIQVADELRGFDMDRARATAAGIAATTLQVLGAARDAGVLPLAAAEKIAEERMAAGPWAGRLYPRARRGRVASRSGARTGLSPCTLGARRPSIPSVARTQSRVEPQKSIASTDADRGDAPS